MGVGQLESWVGMAHGKGPEPWTDQCRGANFIGGCAFFDFMGLVNVWYGVRMVEKCVGCGMHVCMLLVVTIKQLDPGGMVRALL